jgi:hypothetical protein
LVLTEYVEARPRTEFRSALAEAGLPHQEVSGYVRYAAGRSHNQILIAASKPFEALDLVEPPFDEAAAANLLSIRCGEITIAGVRACLFSIFVRRWRSDCDAKKGGWLHHRGLTADLVCLDFHVHQNKFPVPDYREFGVMTSEMLGNLGPDSLRGA